MRNRFSDSDFVISGNDHWELTETRFNEKQQHFSNGTIGMCRLYGGAS